MLEEVERFYTDMIDAENIRTLPGPAAIRHYVEAFTDSVGAHPDYARVWLEWSTAMREEIWPRYLAFQDRIVEALAATIERAKKSDSVAADIDGNDVARLMVGAAHMLAQMKFSGQPDEKISRFIETLMSAVLGIREPTSSRAPYSRAPAGKPRRNAS